VRVRRLRKRLRNLGCRPLRTRGSHEVWSTPGGARLVVVCNHLGRDASKPVLASCRRALFLEGLDLF